MITTKPAALRGERGTAFPPPKARSAKARFQKARFQEARFQKARFQKARRGSEGTVQDSAADRRGEAYR